MSCPHQVGFLSSGNSAYTIDLLKDAGVDITTRTPVRQTLELFEQRLDELDELLPEPTQSS
jgi:oligoendopeptidase F